MRWPDVIIKPQDRIALTGRNGVGKSTWIKHILPLLNVDAERLITLPQELSGTEAKNAIKSLRSLPSAELGQIMSIVSRLNSRPERLLESQQPSPGETRKLLLAMGILQRPHLIIMDEPTNHLDLPSIEALEKALSDCPCALLLASHDDKFIANVRAETWRIEDQASGDSLLVN